MIGAPMRLSQRCQYLLIILSTQTALAACAQQREVLIERGATPAYADGYVAGCDSGKQAAGAQLVEGNKDPNRYRTDSEYTKGWDEAFEKCKADMAIRTAEARRRNPQRDK